MSGGREIGGLGKRPPAVAVKQIVVHRDALFLVDAAGQLWYKEVAAAQYYPDIPWLAVHLPESAT
jgi:hypothetical protein